MYSLPYSEVPTHKEPAKKDNSRVNDKLQDKINMLKYQPQQTKAFTEKRAVRESRDSKEHRDKENIQGSQVKKREDSLKAQRENKEVKRDNWLGGLGEEGRESRIVHNNWIINNQVLKENPQKNTKNPSSKSVIMVKPNYALQNSDQPNRSLRKAGSERKPEK